MLCKLLEKNKKFIKQSEDAKRGYYKVAPLFLLLKNTFSEGFRDDTLFFYKPLAEFVQVLKTKYDNSVLRKALFLLGVSLGREYTYQYMYKKERLDILKMQ